jgi:ribonuclease-3
LSQTTAYPSPEGLEKRIGYLFRDRRILLEALTHKSYYHEHRDSVSAYNERLEFLGDSVIGLVIVEHLYRKEQRYSEAVLAKIKSYLVSEPVLADIAKALSLGEFLLLGKGERTTGGMYKRSVLADALESVIGAVYLDGGFETVRAIVKELFREIVERAIESGDFFDYKTELQEKSQMRYGVLPEYRVVKQQGEEHERIFTVAVFLRGEKLGTASGRKKKEAEARAAKKALEKLS